MVSALATLAGACGGGDDDDGDGGGGGGGSGGGSDGGGGGPPPVTLTCTPGQAQLSLDGAAVQSVALEDNPTVVARAEGFAILGDMGEAGWYEVEVTGQWDAATPLQPANVPESGSPVASALLIPQATSESLGPVYRVDSGTGSTVRRNGQQLELALDQVAVFQACTDHPIEGEINLCFQHGGCDETFDGGQVAGTPWTAQPSTWMGGMGSYDVTLDSGITMRAMRSASATSGAPIYWALIFTPPTSSFGGQILCAGPDSVVVTAGEAPYDYDVWQLRNLGSFADFRSGSSTLAACLPFE